MVLVLSALFTALPSIGQPVAEPPPQKVVTPTPSPQDFPIPHGARATPQDAATLKAWTERYRTHLYIVGDAETMEGRAPDSDGIERAAAYIEGQIKSFGLKPAFPAAAKEGEEVSPDAPKINYRQPFRQGGKLVAAVQKCSIQGGREFEVGKDFNAIGQSGSAELSGPLAFAGYSIDNGESGYQSYPEGTDVTGKVVIVLRFEPMDENGKSRWQQGNGWSMHSGLDPKIVSAFEHGASGVIVVNPPEAADERIKRIENVDSMPSRRSQKGPVIMMSIEAADELIKKADPEGRSLLDLRKLVDESGQVIDLPNATVNIATKLERNPIMTDNIVGILPGRGALAQEYIVIGSHYDHLGIGNFGSRSPNSKGTIHAGADDNASGSSGNLLLAEEITKTYAAMAKANPDQPMRSIMFQWYSAEESGLNGSKYYVKNMAAPADKHVFMLNMDMIGRLRKGQLEVTGTATAEGLYEWVQPYFAHSGLNIAQKSGGMGPSDHQSFFLAKVPILFFFTGLHDQYHRVTDLVDTINCEGAATVCDLVYRLALDLAAMPEPMAHVDNDQSHKSESPMADPGEDKRAEQVADAPPPPRRARFGIKPGDYSGTEPGVLVEEVFPDTSAADAGLKANDLITSWNGTPIKSVQDWMPLLTAGKVGDKVVIEFMRGTETKTVTATLKAPASEN